MFSPSHEMALAPTARDAVFASGCDRVLAAGWEISVATSGMDKSDDGEGRVKNAILIAGPTASGKSALALDLASRLGATIVNADSMQVYSVLNVLTARPGPTELARAPHLLYGHVHPGAAYSTGAWQRDVLQLVDSGALARSHARSSSAAPGCISARWLKAFRKCRTSRLRCANAGALRLAEEGPDRLHRILLEKDPEAAMTLKASDGQRIVRALEVLEVPAARSSNGRQSGGSR